VRKNAFISSTLILTVLVILAGVFVWYYFQHSPSTPFASFLNLLEQPALPDTTGWKFFHNTDLGVQLQYPPTWYDYNDKYLSEFPYTPNNQRAGDTYNAIEMGKITSQAHLGYNNDTFFNKLSTSNVGDSFRNDFYSSDKAIYTLLAKGKLRSEQHFVVYKMSSTDTSYLCDILVGQNFYEFRLISANDEGVSKFIDIMRTVTLD
jgi:hypothetical protein